MKNLVLLTLIFLVSCSHFSEDNRRDLAATGFPARIVKIVSPTESLLEYKNNLSVSIDVIAYKYGTLVAKNRNVKFTVVKGDITLEDVSSSTDVQGKAHAKILVQKYPTNIHLKVRIDNVIKNITMEIRRPAKYIGKFSLNSSTFLVDTASVLGSGKEKVHFQFQAKNSEGLNVDAYGLGVNLILPNGDREKMSEIGNGKYERRKLITSPSGEYKYSVEVDGKGKSSPIMLSVVPDVVVTESLLKADKKKTGEYIVQFALKERVGSYLTSLDGIKVLPVLNGPGKYSKVTYNTSSYRFEYTFYPPAKSGNTAVGISYNGKSYWAKSSFAYEYSPVDASRIKLIISNKKIDIETPKKKQDH